MSKKLIALAALLAALTAGAAWSFLPAAATPAGCCSPGAECCFPGSPCCGEDCCYEGSPCCFPGSPCCEGAGDCCIPGSPCCFPGSPCCAASLVSAEAPKGGKPVAKAGGCCGKCGVKADAPAAKPAANATVIAVEDMECPSCAKKIVAKLSAVAGVAKAEADLKGSRVVVTPKDKAAPSARAMWGAVEKAGFKPARLEGPAGKFTAAPRD
jgi:Cu+-exporting ATPase